MKSAVEGTPRDGPPRGAGQAGDGSPAMVFALAPLSTRPVSRTTVPIRYLDDATGGFGTAQPASFLAVDPGVWARVFLAHLDTICSADWAAVAAPVAPKAYARLLKARETLAFALAEGVVPVLDMPGIAAVPGGDRMAKDTMASLLAGGLSWAFDLAIVVPGATPGSDQGAVGDVAKVLVSKVLVPKTLSPKVLAPGTFRGPVLNWPEGLVHVFCKGERGAEASVDGPWGPMPVPFHNLPPLPSLLSQEGRASHRAPASVSAAALWDHTLVFRHAFVAQDRLDLRIMFGPPAPKAPATVAPHHGVLFEGLAEYACAHETLWRLLSGLKDGAIADAVAAAALDGYAEMAEQVGQDWMDQHGKRLETQGQVNPGDEADEAKASAEDWEVRCYAVSVAFAADGGADDEAYGASTLTLRSAAAEGTSKWPDIGVIGKDGEEMLLTLRQASGGTGVYDFPTGPEVARIGPATPLTLRMTHRELSLDRCFQAGASASVTRNADLLGPDGPPTAESFVLPSATVEFPSALLPGIGVDASIQLGEWTENVKTNPLAGAFQAFPGDGAPDWRVSVAVEYAAGPSSSSSSSPPSEVPLSGVLPVAYLPPSPYALEPVVQQIIDAVRLWQGRAMPPPGGCLRLRVGFHSPAAASGFPTLELWALEAILPVAGGGEK